MNALKPQIIAALAALLLTGCGAADSSQQSSSPQTAAQAQTVTETTAAGAVSSSGTSSSSGPSKAPEKTVTRASTASAPETTEAALSAASETGTAKVSEKTVTEAATASVPKETKAPGSTASEPAKAPEKTVTEAATAKAPEATEAPVSTPSETAPPPSSPEDVALTDSGDGENYTFTYHGEEYSAIFKNGCWKIMYSYKITDTGDMEQICAALSAEHPVLGKDYVSYRTPEDMAVEWQQHNLAYSILPDDSPWKLSARDVDLDPEDQGKSILEMFLTRMR